MADTRIINKINIIVVQEGVEDVRVITLEILQEEVNDEESVLLSVEKACREYLETEEGKMVKEIDGMFGWEKFAGSIPEEICRKYGFVIDSVDNHPVCVYDNERLGRTPKELAEEAVMRAKTGLLLERDLTKEVMECITLDDFISVVNAVMYEKSNDISVPGCHCTAFVPGNTARIQNALKKSGMDNLYQLPEKFALMEDLGEPLNGYVAMAAERLNVELVRNGMK